MDQPLELVKQWLQRGRSDLMGSQGAILGVDIGSYGLRAIAADVQGQQVVADCRELPMDSPEVVLRETLSLAQSVLDRLGRPGHNLLRVGIGFGGPVDSDAGVTRVSHRMAGWENFPLAERFEAALGASTLLDNDASVTALGEATCGAGRDARHLFYLHLSSGVGGGVVIDGRLYHGATTMAGEIGHAIVRYDGPPCSCGGFGHVESYVSVGGLLRRANELGLRTDDLAQLFADDWAGRQTIDEATELLSSALANVVCLFDPQMIVMGGIVVRIGGASFVQAVSDRLEAALPPTMRRHVPTVASTFGNDSVAVGALALAGCSLWD